MKKKINLDLVNLCLALIFILHFSYILNAQETEGCQIAVTNPSVNNMKVGMNLLVKGTARISAGNHLWLLVHRIQGYKNLWWPQGEGEINPVTKNWEVLVTLGGNQDIGFEFEVAAIVVNQQEHARLEAYYQKAMTTGDWRPIIMPAIICAPKIIQVSKASHD